MSVMPTMQKMVQDANEKLRGFFRLQRKRELRDRMGSILVVDDQEGQAKLLWELVRMRGENTVVDSVATLLEAKKYVEEHDVVRIVVVDIRLDGDRDGLLLIDWLRSNYPEIPYIIITGMAHMKSDIEHAYPGTDIFIKGQASIDDFADALGMQINNDDVPVLPDDDQVQSLS